MSIEQLLAEQVRLASAWDAVQVEIRTAERRYRRGRDPRVLAGWDRSLAAQEQIMELQRVNTRALRAAVEDGCGVPTR
jgi:hypothetical protein